MEGRPLDGLKEFENKKINIQLKKGGRLTGILKGFDYNLNLLLEDVVERTEEGDIRWGTILVRGDSVIDIHEGE